MMCTECGWPLWSMESRERGAHPDCVKEEPEAQELEQRLDDALEGGDE